MVIDPVKTLYKKMWKELIQEPQGNLENPSRYNV